MTAQPSPRSPISERAPTPALPPHGARRAIDLGVLLSLLPLLVAVPLLAYGGFLLYVTAGEAAEHARREQAAAHGALRETLASELEHLGQLLSLVADSPGLTAGEPDVQRIESLAQRLVHAGLGIRSLAVLDRGGAVLVDSASPPGPPRVVQLAPHQLRLLETGQAAVSDLYESPLDRRPTVSIDVPARRDGRVAWIVTAALDPAHLSGTLSAQVGSRDAMSTVLDSQRRIVARTRELQRYYGELPSDDTLRALDSGAQGWRRFRTRDGNAYLWTWSTLPGGWTVWLGSPAREFEEALRSSILQLGAMGLGVLLLTMAGTALLARRIAASVDRMAENAHRLVEGERPPYQPSGIRQLDALYQALEDANEKVTRALADRKLALDAERAARAVADEHNRSKDLYLGMLSHELRNPLAPIRNSVYILGHTDPASEQARRARVVIERQTEHLTRLVDDLLDVTRIARGKIELRRARVDLRELVSRAADDFRLVLESRGVTFRASLPAAPTWASCDPTRITQIIGNLLHNASKFTRAGDEVTLSLAVSGDEAHVQVRDTGAGIDPALLPVIFDPFVQGERTLARTEGGLGLGLALVKGIAELHGGTVRAESAGKGLGAAFVVCLPLAEAAPGAGTPEGSAGGPPGERERWRGTSVRALSEDRGV